VPRDPAPRHRRAAAPRARLPAAGGLVGAAIGGAIAQRWGVTAPFWFGFVGSAVFVVLIWRQLSLIAHDDLSPAVA